MNATSIRIISTAGANKRPAYGDVTFSDGKAYSWMFLPDGSISFSTYRKLFPGHSVLASFTSPKRAAALAAALEA